MTLPDSLNIAPTGECASNLHCSVAPRGWGRVLYGLPMSMHEVHSWQSISLDPLYADTQTVSQQ